MCKLYLGVKTTLPSRIVLWSRQLTKLRKDYLKKGFQTILQRANELLSDIRSEIENKSKPNVLKSLLAGLGNILKDAGANALSGLIQAKIQGLF